MKTNVAQHQSLLIQPGLIQTRYGPKEQKRITTRLVIDY